MLYVTKSITFPASLNSVTLSTGKIVMTTSSSELYMSSGIGSVTLNNVLVTSSSGSNNSHQGVDIRCADFSVTNSTFQYGTYGLYVSRSFGAAAKTISGCTFNSNTTGLFLYNGMYTIDNNTFTSNSTSIAAYYTMTPTYIENCTISGTSNYGIYAYGSGYGMHYLTKTQISNATEGIYSYHNYLNFLCCTISSNYVGIRLSEASYGYFATVGTRTAGHNIITSNNYGVLGSGSSSVNNYFYLNGGYNKLISNGSYFITGSFYGNSGGSYACNYNYWRTSSPYTPRSGYEYSGLTGASGVAIVPTDAYPQTTYSTTYCPSISTTQKSGADNSGGIGDNSELGQEVAAAIALDDENNMNSRKKSASLN